MTSGQPDPETIKRAIGDAFDRGADSYDQVGVDFFTPAARDLVAHGKLHPGERVLDVGTGRGAVLFEAAAQVGPTGRAVGIDVSERMVELTAADAAARDLPQVSVARGDAERPDFADGSFDAILAGLVLFMLPDPSAALGSYRKLLVPGGRLCFSTFGTQDPNFDAAMKRLGGFVPGGVPPRSQLPDQFSSRDGITGLLTTTGFADAQIDEIRYQSRFADRDHWLSWLWSHGSRIILERIPAESFDEAIAAAKEAFEPARTPAGDYLINTEIRFTVTARR